MFNRNAFKSALIFLGIIFVGIIVNLFLTENEIFVQKNDVQQTATIYCADDQEIC